MKMSDKELNQIVMNEIEWRKQLWKKVEKTEESFHDFKVEMTKITTTNKVKIGIASSFFGAIGGVIVTILSLAIK